MSLLVEVSLILFEARADATKHSVYLVIKMQEVFKPALILCQNQLEVRGITT